MTEQEFDSLMGLMIKTSEFSFQKLVEIYKLDEEKILEAKNFLRENSEAVVTINGINEVMLSQISDIDLMVIKELRDLAQLLELEKSSYFYVDGNAEKRLAEWYLYLKAMNKVKKVVPTMLYRLKNYHKLTPFDSWQSINCKDEPEISYAQLENAIRAVCCETLENSKKMPESKKEILIKILQEIYDGLRTTRLFSGCEITQDLIGEIEKIDLDFSRVSKSLKPLED